MNGNWLRVSPAELDRAKNDLDWAYDLAEEAMNEEEAARWSGTGTAWNALSFLLERRGVRTSVVRGEESFVDLPDADPDSDEMVEYLDSLAVDWGYGPPSYLTPEQVATAAGELAGLTEDDLIRDVDPAELTRADIYPPIWQSAEDLRWAAHYLPGMQRFFAAAAKDGDAVICWLN